jgi:hypothetical protein
MAGIGWAPLGGEWWTWQWCEDMHSIRHRVERGPPYAAQNTKYVLRDPHSRCPAPPRAPAKTLSRRGRQAPCLRPGRL